MNLTQCVRYRTLSAKTISNHLVHSNLPRGLKRLQLYILLALYFTFCYILFYANFQRVFLHFFFNCLLAYWCLRALKFCLLATACQFCTPFVHLSVHFSAHVISKRPLNFPRARIMCRHIFVILSGIISSNNT